jgi:hypothetical protein
MVVVRGRLGIRPRLASPGRVREREVGAEGSHRAHAAHHRTGPGAVVPGTKDRNLPEAFVHRDPGPRAGDGVHEPLGRRLDPQLRARGGALAK